MNTEVGVILLQGLSLRVEEQWKAGSLVRITLSPAGDDQGPTTPVGKELEEILQGRRRDPSFPFRLLGTRFQKLVWAAAQEIPWGRRVTYGELARRIGCRSPRAVGQALKANPLPIIVPCHRVVAKGGLGGYSCGTEIKARLLEMEGGAS